MSGLAGTVFERLFQHVICQEARDERGGHLKDGEKRHNSLEECGRLSDGVVFGTVDCWLKK